MIMKKNRKPEKQKTPAGMPLWTLAVLVSSVLPIVGWPWYMTHLDPCKEGAAFLTVVFPLFVVLCGYLAYKCYPYRREIAYILLVIMWLSYAAAFFL